MTRILIDTNTYSNALSDNSWARQILKQADEILLCPIVAGELFSGFKRGLRSTQNMRVFKDFLSSVRVSVVPMTLDTSEYYSLILEQLRREGKPIPTNDIWIAASTMEHGAHLATFDQHFLHVAGLLTLYPNGDGK